MPFTLRNIKEDLEDIGPRFDGAPDLEFRAATNARAGEIRPELPAHPARLSLSVRPHAHAARGGVRGAARDIVKDLRSGGRIELDGKVVQENGIWVA